MRTGYPVEQTEDNETAIYSNDKLNKAGSIIQFLDAHREDTLHNGHLQLTAYWEEGQTNLTLSDHKTIRLLSKSPAALNKLRECLHGHAIEEHEDLTSFIHDIYHYHYRRTAGRDRNELENYLRQSGFRKWDP